MKDGEATILLFSYGTLRDPDVQRRLFGRRVEEEADALRGYRLATVVIDGETYPSLMSSGRPADRVSGLVLRLTETDLAAADAYEGTTEYVRATVCLESGRKAFVYVSAG